MKIYREVGSLPIVNREDAEGYARPVYSIEVEEAVPIEDYRSMEQTVNKLIKALAEAEPIRHGEWKPYDLTWGRSVYSCTNCGTAMEVPREMGEPIYNYCPYCGAKMNEVTE